MKRPADRQDDGGGKPPFVFVSSVRVTTAEEARRLDAATIDGTPTVPSRALMQRAGAAAAAELVRAFPDGIGSGVRLFAGPGNNGGDAWVVARALRASRIPVAVEEIGEAKSPDAQAERELARRVLDGDGADQARLVVDGLLGTGSTGAPRGSLTEGIARINRLRAGGARVIALDIPSGVDATTGEATEAVTADLTLAFGTLKRGHLTARGRCGRIIVVDIGLRDSGDGAGIPLVDGRAVRATVPRFDATAHKGDRGKLAIVGGGSGMAGAAVLASRSAMRSGVGMVRLVVAPSSVAAVQGMAIEALARPWPNGPREIERDIIDWADGLLLGPGLGEGEESRALVDRLLDQWPGPVVLDADALNVYAGDAEALARKLGGRPALLTPHPAEFGRLAGMPVDEVLADRFDAAVELARSLGATILLKGTPTVITAPDGQRLVSAAGTPVLAQAGSGDVLSGIAATLLMQMEDPLSAGGCAAWIHGHAAELAQGRSPARGVPLERVVAALERVWDAPLPPSQPPVLADLPRVRG